MKNAYNTSAYGSFAYVYDIFMEKVILFVCFEIVVSNIIINQAGIPAIILFDAVIHPYL